MTQYQSFKQITNSLKSQTAKVAFASNWLEDINWHTENRMLLESIPERMQEELTVLLQLYIAQNKSSYSESAFDALRKTYEITPDILRSAQKLSENKTVSVRGIIVNSYTFYEYKRAHNEYTTLSTIYGYGIDNSFKNTSGEALVEDIKNIIKKGDE